MFATLLLRLCIPPLIALFHAPYIFANTQNLAIAKVSKILCKLENTAAADFNFCNAAECCTLMVNLVTEPLMPIP